MTATFLSVINTTETPVLVNDATRPFAVVERTESAGGRIVRVLSRHETYRAARGSCTKRIKAQYIAR